MSTVGAYEAKTHLPRLLDEVERGATVVITRHGREIARLVPATSDVDVGAVLDELRAERRGVRRGPDSVRSMIDDGRR